MEGLLWLLVIAGLFYVMMRFGCGAHMIHGGHAGMGLLRPQRRPGNRYRAFEKADAQNRSAVFK